MCDNAKGDATESQLNNMPIPAGKSTLSVDRWTAGVRILDDEFVVEQRLGSGGFGEVFLVRMEPRGRTNRPYVVTGGQYAAKRILTSSGAALSKIISEIQSWNELPLHPHILPYKFHRLIDGGLVIFSEFMPGGSIIQAKARNAISTPTIALDLAIQSAWGLEAIHACGFVHQDVKPANVLLSTDLVAKIGDFGLVSEMAAVESPEARKGEARVRGRTKKYASPEQRRNESLTFRSDIWSWGRALLDVFTEPTDVLPDIETRNLIDQIERVRNRLRSEVAAKQLISLFEHCLEATPEARPTSMGEVAETLIDIYEEESQTEYERWRPITRSPLAFDDWRPDKNQDWIQARRRLNEASHHLFDEMDKAQAAGDTPRGDALYELMKRMPGSTTAISPDLGRTPSAQAFKALSMVCAAQELTHGLIEMGREDLLEEYSGLSLDAAERTVRLGDQRNALVFIDHAIASFEQLIFDRQQLDKLPRLLSATRYKATILNDTGSPEDCVICLHECIALCEEMLGNVSGELRDSLKQELFMLLAEEGVALVELKDYTTAIQRFRHAMQMLEEGKQRGTGSVDFDRHLAWMLTQMGTALDESGDPNTAVECYDRSIYIYDCLEQQHQWFETSDLDSALLNKAVTLSRLGKPELAIPLYDRSIAFRSEAVKRDQDWQARHRLAFALLNKAGCLRKVRDFKQAEKYADSALNIWKDLVENKGLVQLGQFQYMAITEAGCAGAEIEV